MAARKTARKRKAGGPSIITDLAKAAEATRALIAQGLATDPAAFQAPQDAMLAQTPPADPPPPDDTKPQDPPAEEPAKALSHEQRNNPRHLSGQALRELAHKWGMAWSTLEGMPDDRIRVEMRYIEQRRIEEAETT
jgi:hypothetical protein